MPPVSVIFIIMQPTGPAQMDYLSCTEMNCSSQKTPRIAGALYQKHSVDACDKQIDATLMTRTIAIGWAALQFCYEELISAQSDEVGLKVTV
jgi:hypothetical protein